MGKELASQEGLLFLFGLGHHDLAEILVQNFRSAQNQIFRAKLQISVQRVSIRVRLPPYISLARDKSTLIGESIHGTDCSSENRQSN